MLSYPRKAMRVVSKVWHVLLLFYIILVPVTAKSDKNIFGWGTVKSAFNAITSLWTGCREPDARKTEELRDMLRSKVDLSSCSVTGLVGQHIALEMVPFAVSEHYRPVWKRQSSLLPTSSLPNKPLVLALLGEPGLGKSYTERLLRENIFRESTGEGNSANSITLLGTNHKGKKDEPDFEHRLRNYRCSIVSQIVEAVQRCPSVMIVIDELQFFADGVLDSISGFVGHSQPVQVDLGVICSNRDVDNARDVRIVDFRKAIFILTANYLGPAINRKTEELLLKNDWPEDFYQGTIVPDTRHREAIDIDDYRFMLKKGMMDKVSNWLIYKDRVDEFIPYLPMTQVEVAELIGLHLQSYRCKFRKEKKLTNLLWEDQDVHILSISFIKRDWDTSEPGACKRSQKRFARGLSRVKFFLDYRVRRVVERHVDEPSYVHRLQSNDAVQVFVKIIEKKDECGGFNVKVTSEWDEATKSEL
eukprot:UC4_evm1s351